MPEGIRTSRTRRSLALSFVQRYLDLALRLTGTVVLARLIPPEEFGIYVVAAAIVGVLWIIGEFGLPQYLIKTEKLGPEERSRIFGVAIVASTLVVGAICGGAVFLPDAWLAPEMRAVLFVLGLSILPQPLVSLYKAELQREMRFDALLVANTTAVACSVGLAISLAALGQGAVSLAWGNVAETGCLLLFALARHRGVPTPAFSFAEWRSIVQFGRAASTIAALRQAGDAAPSLVLGAVAGFAPAGLFSRAQAVASLFDRAVLQAVSPVILPLLAGRLRAGEDIGRLYRLKMAYLTALAWPFFALLALWAEPVVALLLGERWIEAVPVVQLLCVAGILLPFNQMNHKFFLALGLIDRYLRVQLVAQPVKILAVFGLVLVSPGLVALAIVLEQAIKSALTQRILHRALLYEKAKLWRSLAGSAFTTALTVLATATLLWLGDTGGRGIALLPGVAVLAAVGWLAGIVLSGHPLRQELTRITRITGRPLQLLRRQP